MFEEIAGEDKNNDKYDTGHNTFTIAHDLSAGEIKTNMNVICRKNYCHAHTLT